MDKNEIQKPASAVKKEFRKNLDKLISESGIHISFVDEIIQNISFNIHNLAMQIEEQESQQYEKALEESKK